MSAAPLATALLAAARVIGACLGGRTLDDALAAARLEGVVLAATRDLASGALRAYGRGDFFLAQLMARPVAEAEVRGLLLAALYRLEARPADVHTTVDQAVRAAGVLVHGRFKALVNGVLRNFLRRQPELSAAAAADPVAASQHPRWWLDELKAGYPADWQAIVAADNGRPPMTLRVNRRQTDATGYAAELAAAGIGCRVLDVTAIRLDRPVAVDRLPGFASGRVSVQDWGAQQAARLLDVGDGMRVLDACAAPGGKTGHLLEAAVPDLLALEMDPVRAGRIDANLGRLGLAATVKVADCRHLASWWDGRPFDRILADVPCSASGVVRRHPDIKWLRRQSDLDGFARSQEEILDALWQVLAPGGKMLYATCSLFQQENGAQVAAFVTRQGDAQRLPTGGEDNEWQLRPDTDHDGFYYALLAKRP
jgi:16S rRNA (cytosine967-C5)-methyltransferase